MESSPKKTNREDVVMSALPFTFIDLPKLLKARLRKRQSSEPKPKSADVLDHARDIRAVGVSYGTTVAPRGKTFVTRGRS
jgi:hypothetical protein